MRRFANLYQQLDSSTATDDKIAALKRYFADAPAADAAWGVYFLAGGKPRQVVPTASLRGLACELAGIDDWLFEASYQAVGDLAETIALVLPNPAPMPTTPMRANDNPAAPDHDDADDHDRHDHQGLAWWLEQRLLPLRGLAPEEQTLRLREWLGELDAAGRFLLIRLIGGGLRVGVAKLMVQRALAELAGIDPKIVAQRMMGFTDRHNTPTAAAFDRLVSKDSAPALDAGQPYPFFLAHPWVADASAGGQTDGQAAFPKNLGVVDDWLVEWKYDGIRAQVVKRARQVWIWSRGEELMTDRFPEIVALAQGLPDGTVLDGEILVWHAGDAAPAPFKRLQQRIGRKSLSKKLLADAPVMFLAYDLLEMQGIDCRTEPQAVRRQRLEALLESGPMPLSPRLLGADWPALAAFRNSARQRHVEGLMLKRLTSAYGSGRTKADGLWLKWKLDPLSVDCVLIYAQAGHGRRASLYTDYTFAVWSRPPLHAAEAQTVVDAIEQRLAAQPGTLQLVPFAKAYSGLSDEEFKFVDREVRKHTLGKFGPVRSVKPTLVFELTFEGIDHSPRHKSGIAVRFPRMLRIRADKPLHEADTLDSLRALMAVPAEAAEVLEVLEVVEEVGAAVTSPTIGAL